jgi:hypothetical protein
MKKAVIRVRTKMSRIPNTARDTAPRKNLKKTEKDSLSKNDHKLIKIKQSYRRKNKKSKTREIFILVLFSLAGHLSTWPCQAGHNVY